MSTLPDTDINGWAIVTSYADILNAVAEDIRATGLFRPAARIEAAPGALSEEYLKKNAMPHGGALPAIAGVAEIKRHSNGIHRHVLNMGLYFIPAPANRKRQATDLANDVSEIIGSISLNRWKLAGTKIPDNIRAANKYSAVLDAKGSTLWTIDWRQTFLLADQEEGAKQLQLIAGQEEQSNAS